MSRMEKVTRSVSDSEMRQRALLSARQLPSLAPEPKKKRKGKLKLVPSFESPAVMSASSPVPLSTAAVPPSIPEPARGQAAPSRAQKEIESVVAMWAAGSESHKKKRASIAALMGKRTRAQSLKQASDSPIKVTPSVSSEPSTPSSTPAVSPSSPRRQQQLQQSEEQLQQHELSEDLEADSVTTQNSNISLQMGGFAKPSKQSFELYCVTPRNLSPSDTPPLGYREILGRSLCKSEGSDSDFDASVRSDQFYDLSSDGESL